MILAKRPLCRDDIVLAARIHERCFGDEAWSPDQIEGSLLLPTTRGQGAWADQTLVGFFLIQCVEDETEILTLAVDPQHQRCGVGRDLLREILGQQHAGSVFLEVAKDNGPAIALYESRGFCRVGCRPGYYRRKDKLVDALNYRYLVNG